MGKRIFITKKMVFIVNIQFPFLKMITILKSIILTLEFLIQKADFHHNLNIFHKTGIFLLTHPEVRLFYSLSLASPLYLIRCSYIFFSIQFSDYFTALWHYGNQRLPVPKDSTARSEGPQIKRHKIETSRSHYWFSPIFLSGKLVVLQQSN